MTEKLRIVVPARAENVAVLRRALSGLGEAIGLDRADLGDLQTIVTEASMNVVQHAYDGGEGPLELTAARSGDGLDVTIRDQGTGFRPRPADPGRGDLRLGLPLIAALSDGFEISGGPGRGTEVRVRKLIVRPEEASANGVRPEVPAATMLSFEGDIPAGSVLSRVIAMLASRADLSIDRLADSQMLGDAVSTTATRELPEGRLEIEISDDSGRLEIGVGPLAGGGAERLLKEMELPQPLGGSLQRLASEVRTEDAGDGMERLVIVVEDPR